MPSILGQEAISRLKLTLGSLWSVEAIWCKTRAHLESDLSLDPGFVIIRCVILGLSLYFSEPLLSHL